jgi:hypothetical protein
MNLLKQRSDHFSRPACAGGRPKFPPLYLNLPARSIELSLKQG